MEVDFSRKSSLFLLGTSKAIPTHPGLLSNTFSVGLYFRKLNNTTVGPHSFRFPRTPPAAQARHPLPSSPNSEAVFFQPRCPTHTLTGPEHTHPQPSHGPTLQTPPFPRRTAGPDEALVSSPSMPSTVCTASGAPMVRGEVGLTCSAANLARIGQGSGTP